ncbi:hypothetical protein JOD54_005542 [Actinokineospora baliensis]|uniref:hypothetical protein n=1 Tax=Actinokineospora baliensis TaxID=547056 RepID=UPI001958860B|nr:hypothetical protein [Actinokineospora baliensis]MBM7775338.1 hypothetical protein [Actinokineospora baliensis]
MRASPPQCCRAVVAAFNDLGLPTEHLGDDGDWPGGELRTKAGRLGDVLALEAKCAGDGAVQEASGGLVALVNRQAIAPLSPGQLTPLLDPTLSAVERCAHFERLRAAQDRAARIERDGKSPPVYRATMTFDTMRRRIAGPGRQWDACS